MMRATQIRHAFSYSFHQINSDLPNDRVDGPDIATFVDRLRSRIQSPVLHADVSASPYPLQAAKQSRYPERDAALILTAYRHGLRAQEIVDLEWSQVEFGRNARLHMRRVKGGVLSVHPLQGDEIRALRELESNGSKYVSATERGGPFTTDAINRQIKTIGARAAMPFPVHAHMQRHTCSFKDFGGTERGDTRQAEGRGSVVKGRVTSRL
jgi:integrase